MKREKLLSPSSFFFFVKAACVFREIALPFLIYFLGRRLWLHEDI